MKLYLAGPMFTAADAAYNLALAARLRARDFEVFCPNESEPTNDKTRTDITPRLIYDVDIQALESSTRRTTSTRSLPEDCRRPWAYSWTRSHSSRVWFSFGRSVRSGAKHDQFSTRGHA